MPVDANIAMGFRPPLFDNPTNMLAQILQMQHLQTQNQFGTMQMQQAQADMADNASLRQYIKTAPDLGTPEGRAGLYAAAPLKAGAVLKDQADLAKTQALTKEATAKAGKDNYDVAKGKVEMNARRLFTVNDVPGAIRWVDEAVSRGDISPETGAAEKAQIPQDPSQIPKWRAAKMNEGMDVHQRLSLEQQAKQHTDTVAATMRGQDMSQQTSLTTNALTSATSRANNANTQAGENARAAAARKTQLTVAGLDASGNPLPGGGGLSEEARINAAARYNMDGTLPPSVGRGAQGAIEIKQILNEAAHQAAMRGDTPESQRIAQLANKSSAQALSKLSGQEAVVGAAEKNFTANANMVSGLSAKVDRTGVPILNKWINVGKRSIQGDPDISALDANIKATVNEYAKIVGGGTGGGATAQGEVAKIEGLLSAAQSPAQIEAVLNVMRKETANRMQSFKDQKSELTNSMLPVRAGAAPAADGLPSMSAIDAEIARRRGKK